MSQWSTILMTESDKQKIANTSDALVKYASQRMRSSPDRKYRKKSKWVDAAIETHSNMTVNDSSQVFHMGLSSNGIFGCLHFLD